MERNHGISTLPVDILLTIFRAVCDIESDITQYSVPEYPDDVYLNRYRRPAKILRRVCRQWCHLVDLPSSYFLRVTTARLILTRSHLQGHSNRVNLRTKDFTPKTIDAVSQFVEEMHSIITLQKRLIGLHACIHQADILGVLRGILQKMDRSAPLSHIMIEAEQGIPKRDEQPILPEVLGIPKAKVEPEVFHLGQLESVRQLGLWNSWCNATILLPPALTTLSLDVQLNHLPSVLASCGDHLKTVELFITNNLSDEEEEKFYMHPSIILPAVKVLSILADSRTAQIAVKKIMCPNLEEILFGSSTDGDWESPEIKDIWKTGKATMPNLKRLQVPYMDFLTFCLFSVIDLPQLEQFAIAECIPFEEWENLSADTMNTVRGLQFKALICENTTYSWLAALAGILDFKMVEEFLITVPTHGILDPNFDKQEFSFVLPNIKNLSIAGKNLSLISEILSRMKIGEQIETLEFTHLVDQYAPSTEYVQRYPKLARSLTGNPTDWEVFVSNGVGGFDRVKTIITIPPPKYPQSCRFLQSLFGICQKVGTFVIKDLTMKLLEALPYLDEIQSKCKDSPELPDVAIGLHLEHLILETAPPSEFIDLLDLKPKLEVAFNSFAAARVAAGAVEMKHFTVRLVDPLEVSEAVEYPMDHGAVLRLEVVNKPTCAVTYHMPVSF